METKKSNDSFESNFFTRRHRNLGGGKYLVAFLFIIVGILLGAKNMGWLSPYVFNIIVSWQVLLIVIGIYSLMRGEITRGLILNCVGIVFILPKLGIVAYGGIFSWPVIFIVIGLIILLKPRRRMHNWHYGNQDQINGDEKSNTVDGFVYSTNSFGEIRQTVNDPVFKGANLKNSFGSNILDLRRTSLKEGETIIMVECSFGGIEIYAPNSWNIRTEVQSFMGGVEDSRLRGAVTDTSRNLIIRGNLSFAGLTIKD